MSPIAFAILAGSLVFLAGTAVWYIVRCSRLKERVEELEGAD
jgi:hypothetical protein